MLWFLLLLVLVAAIVWVHCARGMSIRDRIEIATEIIQTAKFTAAEGFEAATREDPDLAGWMQAEKNCVMLFRTADGGETREIVDFVSDSFHPGLIIHYKNSEIVRADNVDITDERVQKKAAQLLREVRQLMAITHGEDDFGCRY